jgi:hypothetical protein
MRALFWLFYIPFIAGCFAFYFMGHSFMVVLPWGVSCAGCSLLIYAVRQAKENYHVSAVHKD